MALDLPIVADDDNWPPIEIENASIHFEVNVPDVRTLAEAVDLAIVKVGRYGLEPLNVIIQDDDNPARRWLMREGKLYDLLELRTAEDGDPDA